LGRCRHIGPIKVLPLLRLGIYPNYFSLSVISLLSMGNILVRPTRLCSCPNWNLWAV